MVGVERRTVMPVIVRTSATLNAPCSVAHPSRTDIAAAGVRFSGSV
jgi:hypothetical protein